MSKGAATFLRQATFRGSFGFYFLVVVIDGGVGGGGEAATFLRGRGRGNLGHIVLKGMGGWLLYNL